MVKKTITELASACLSLGRQWLFSLTLHLLSRLCIHQHFPHTGALSHISGSAIIVLLDENRLASDVLVVSLDSGLCCLSSKNESTCCIRSQNYWKLHYFSINTRPGVITKPSFRCWNDIHVIVSFIKAETTQRITLEPTKGECCCRFWSVGNVSEDGGTWRGSVCEKLRDLILLKCTNMVAQLIAKQSHLKRSKHYETLLCLLSENV